jgi:anti-anti-sigma regulatory factor
VPHQLAADGPSFEITVSHDGLAALLQVTGRVDCFAGPALATVVQALVEAGQDAVIDLTDVATPDASGLDALAKVVDELERSGHRLEVRQPQVLCTPTPA